MNNTKTVKISEDYNNFSMDNEPLWLKEYRAKAEIFYNKEPLPKRAKHLWRYTNPKKFFIDPATVIEEESQIRYEYDKNISGQGVIIKPLHKALMENDNAQKHFMTTVGIGHGKFEALNARLWTSGLYIEIPDGLSIKEPLLIKRDVSAHSFVAGRILLVVGSNTNVSIIDELFGSSTSQDYLSLVTEAVVKEGSTINFMSINSLSNNSHAMETSRIRLERDAHLNWTFANIGGATYKGDYGSTLAGKNSHSNIEGVLLGNKSQHTDYHTVQEHLFDHTYSNINFRVVLKDQAHSSYTGLIRILPEAVSSEAYQENKNLLLSNNARTDSIPELEILTDEVRCKHGVTAGPVDEEHLFYLMSRGIPRDEAVKIVVRGFLEPILEKIPASLMERFSDEITSALDGID